MDLGCFFLGDDEKLSKGKTRTISKLDQKVGKGYFEIGVVLSFKQGLGWQLLIVGPRTLGSPRCDVCMRVFSCAHLIFNVATARATAQNFPCNRPKEQNNAVETNIVAGSDFSRCF